MSAKQGNSGARRPAPLVMRLLFDRRQIILRQAKGGKDRTVMLPDALRNVLREQVERVRVLWEQDRREDRAGVWLPDALAVKHPETTQIYTHVMTSRASAVMSPLDA